MGEGIADFCGIEFDWFAVDATGAIGLFATGGWGDIPGVVVRQVSYHQQIARQFLLPHFGSLNSWDDFARYGLYVFDWNPYEGPYLKVAQPLAELDSGLKKNILNIPELLLLPVSFQNVGHAVVTDFNPLR